MGNLLNCFKDRMRLRPCETESIYLKHITDILSEINVKDISELHIETNKNIDK